MNDPELWKQCARWLKDVGVLSEHHRVFQYEAKMFDLAQTLRDGVVLSNVLVIIDPSITSQIHVHCRPQMSQVFHQNMSLKYFKDFYLSVSLYSKPVACSELLKR